MEISSPQGNFCLNYDGLDLKSHFSLEPIKVQCSEMPCNAVKEHLLCRQWTTEGVCSHKYIGIDILVS